MLFDLSFELDKGHLRAAAHVGAKAGGVKRPSGQSEIQRQTVFGFSRNFLECSVQLHQIGSVALQKFFELCDMPISYLFERLAEFFLQIAEGNFHRSTRIVGFGSGLPPEGSCWYPLVEYSKLGGLAQPVDGAGVLRFRNVTGKFGDRWPIERARRRPGGAWRGKPPPLKRRATGGGDKCFSMICIPHASYNDDGRGCD
jgi:hypothetical protein